MKDIIIDFLYSFAWSAYIKDYNSSRFNNLIEKIINDKNMTKEFEDGIKDTTVQEIVAFVIKETRHNNVFSLFKYLVNNPNSELAPAIRKMIRCFLNDENGNTILWNTFREMQKLNTLTPLAEHLIDDMFTNNSLGPLFYDEFNKLSLSHKRELISHLIRDQKFANSFQFLSTSLYCEVRTSVIPVLTDDVVFKKNIGNLEHNIFKFYIPNEEIIDKEAVRVALGNKVFNRNARAKCLVLYKSYRDVIKNCGACVSIQDSQVKISCSVSSSLFTIYDYKKIDPPSSTDYIIKKLSANQKKCRFCNVVSTKKNKISRLNKYL